MSRSRATRTESRRAAARPQTMPPLVMFDLDGTLAESKQPIDRAMAHLLARLLARAKVAVVSGGALPQFLKQVVARLDQDAALTNLYLLPTSGAALYEYRNGGWDKIYEERISEADAARIEAAAREGAEVSGAIDFSEPAWGERIEYRGAQVTLSALGQEAPVAEKKAWDPDKSKRRALQKEIDARLPEGFTALMGGATSIDITRAGIDKAYGIRQLAARLSIPESSVLYVGDELTEGGNDAPAFSTEAQTAPVASPAETLRLIGALLAAS